MSEPVEQSAPIPEKVQHTPFTSVKDLPGLSAAMRESSSDRSVSTNRWLIDKEELASLGNKIVELGADRQAMAMINGRVLSGWAQDEVKEELGEAPQYPDGTLILTDNHAAYRFLPSDLAERVVGLAEEDLNLRKNAGFGDIHDAQAIKVAKNFLKNKPKE